MLSQVGGLASGWLVYWIPEQMDSAFSGGLGPTTSIYSVQEILPTVALLAAFRIYLLRFSVPRVKPWNFKEQRLK